MEKTYTIPTTMLKRQILQKNREMPRILYGITVRSSIYLSIVCTFAGMFVNERERTNIKRRTWNRMYKTHRKNYFCAILMCFTSNVQRQTACDAKIQQ